LPCTFVVGIIRNTIGDIKLISEGGQSAEVEELNKHPNAVEPVSLSVSQIVRHLGRPDPPHE
jgi:hypothetical protein